MFGWSRRDFLKKVGICAAAVALPRVTFGRSRRRKAKPNFVFILSDDQGWTGLSVQMHDAISGSKSDFYRTPSLEKLARQGMRFSSAYAPAPNCAPTRCSILTGKNPAQLHFTTVGPVQEASESMKLIPPPHNRELSAGEITIAEMLKRAGYATAHLGKWHLMAGGPGEHGFDQHDGETGNAGPGLFEDPNPKDIFGITERGSAFMAEQVKAGKPFYLQLSHYAVHTAHLSLKKTEQACANRELGEVHTNVPFAAMTEDLDTGVGMILDKIEQLGITDNTYVIYMSDNGAAVRASSNEPLAKGKGSLWEGGIRVPLIVRGPGIKAGLFCHAPVVGYDLFPTFCELAGLSEPPPKGVEGGSLVPLFRSDGKGEVKRPRKELAFHFPHYGRTPENTPHSTIRLGDYKLIKSYETGELHLFNLAEDIGEEHDLAQQMPERAAELHRRLNKYLKDINAQMPVVNPNYDPDKVPTGRPGPARKVKRAGRARTGSREKPPGPGPRFNRSQQPNN